MCDATDDQFNPGCELHLQMSSPCFLRFHFSFSRALVAVLENYQRAEGGIDIPAALQPYMGGMTALAA